MTQGIYVRGRRPRSKKEIKELLDMAYDPNQPNLDILRLVRIEATSMFGNEFDGQLSDAPTTKTFTFVGPDPYTSRKFYGNITYNPKKERWEVK